MMRQIGHRLAAFGGQVGSESGIGRFFVCRARSAVQAGTILMISRALRRALHVFPAALAVTAFALPAAVMAQSDQTPAPNQAPAPAQAPASTSPGTAQVTPSPGTKWVKVCSEDATSKKQVCQVIQQVTASGGQFIASVNIQTLADNSKMVLAAAVRMPTTGMLVGPGMRTQIDNGKEYQLHYSICFPEVCYADMQIDDNFITAMKAGSQLNVIALTQQKQKAAPISIPLTLVGFTKAYDGEGIDPAAAQAMRNDLAKSLKEHADQARQKLLEEQKAATGNSGQ